MPFRDEVVIATRFGLVNGKVVTGVYSQSAHTREAAAWPRATSVELVAMRCESVATIQRSGCSARGRRAGVTSCTQVTVACVSTRALRALAQRLDQQRERR